MSGGPISVYLTRSGQQRWTAGGAREMKNHSRISRGAAYLGQGRRGPPIRTSTSPATNGKSSIGTQIELLIECKRSTFGEHLSGTSSVFNPIY